MNNKLYYVYDVEGIEPPEGPYTAGEATIQLFLKGNGWSIMDEETAKEVYTYLDEDQL